MSPTPTTDPVVSYDDEPLILVDGDDRVLGYEPKDVCHQGGGKLHRAFSVFLFDGRGRVLVQQRSDQKLLWPLYWSNGCCSHPRRGEEVPAAAVRRTREELNVEGVDLEYLFKFQYQVPFQDRGSENELCSVFVGRYDGDVRVNANEIAAWKWMDWRELDEDLRLRPEHYTPWLRMEWQRMRADFWGRIEALWEDGGSRAAFEDVRARWLPEVERRLEASCGMGGLLAEMVRFHLGTGGKRLRALLPVWMCQNLGGDPAAAVDVGVGLELLHNATLVHDDLQDGDQVRRGQATVWRRWGEAQAINAGDSLYFQGIGVIAGTTHLDPAAVQACVRIASDALVRVIQGQTMEFQLQLPAGHADRIEPNLESWEQMARGKTAALFGACLASGAVAAGANPQQVAEAQALGEDIGLLFQVQDDYLDLVGEKGRERRATDLAEGKLSFPVLWAYAHGDAKDTERLAQIVAAPREETTDAMIDEGLALLERCGALEGTGRWLLRFGEEVRRRPLAAVVPGLCEQILQPVARALGRAA